MCNKSCFDCIHANIYGGYAGSFYEPPEAPEAECQLDFSDEMIDLFESLEWHEDKMPEVCGHFEPKMILYCFGCKQPMSVPEYSWELWAIAEDRVPVCCEACKTKVENAYLDPWGGFL